METRILRTDFWDDDKIVSLNLDTKLLYLCLLTNRYIGQLRIFRMSGRTMSFVSGLSIDQLVKCKSDLQSSELAFFKNDYVCITGSAYVESTYSGGKNAIAKQKKINEIPQDVLDHFNTILDTLSIPYRYTIDRDLNLNLNNKSKEQENVVKIKTVHGIEFDETSDVFDELENGDVVFKQK